jgi:hypothetical protein
MVQYTFDAIKHRYRSNNNHNSSSNNNNNNNDGLGRWFDVGSRMLVGGVAINVDPPQRSVELTYRFDQSDWAQVIGLNSRDFGPLLHQGSAREVTNIERGLYCESFVHSAIKWDACPKDLRDIVKNHHVEKPSYASLLKDTMDVWEPRTKAKAPPARSPKVERADEDNQEGERAAGAFLDNSRMPFECRFAIQGVSKDELESITDPVSLERAILRAIVLVAKDKLLVDDFSVEANRLTLSSSLEDETTTQISLEFHFEAEGEEEDILPIAQSIKPTLIQAFNDGSFCEAIVEAATEQGWFEEIIDEISDDWFFFSQDGGGLEKLDLA